MNLTDAQRDAITFTRDQNLQLIACAGSGKTEVVARRVVHLLSPHKGPGLTPANIVAFTFTDKAAAELKERVHMRCREALGNVTGLADMFVGTIHGFCLDLPLLKRCSVVQGLKTYEHLLDTSSYLDYSGILKAAVKVIASDSELRHRLADRIRYVIVDEYQDVNPIQEAIVRHLHDLGAKVCVVGDDDQTIYQ